MWVEQSEEEFIIVINNKLNSRHKSARENTQKFTNNKKSMHTKWNINRKLA